MCKQKTWKKRSHYIGNKLYVSMDASGRISLPRGVLPYKGYRVVCEDDEVHIIRDNYSNYAENTRITINAQIRNRLALKPNCIFQVDNRSIDGEERLILRKEDNESIEW
ncbi:MAG: hypothetical protein IJY74_04940 [Oscillospiraceae bacterium]|nr:hypothetical protein [Oscillospiraceae bacterium]